MLKCFIKIFLKCINSLLKDIYFIKKMYYEKLMLTNKNKKNYVTHSENI